MKRYGKTFVNCVAQQSSSVTLGLLLAMLYLALTAALSAQHAAKEHQPSVMLLVGRSRCVGVGVGVDSVAVVHCCSLTTNGVPIGQPNLRFSRQQ
jgi:hypothetical protein